MPIPPLRFIVIADTHLGRAADADLQPDRLPELLAALATLIRNRGDIAFVLHGGDVVERPEPALIRQAASLLRLPVPTCLALGQSDLPDESASQRWLDHAPALFPERRLARTVALGPQRLDLVPPTEAALAPVLAERDGGVRLLCTHQAVLGQPSRHGGTLADRILTNPCIRLVLASHNHLPSHVQRQGVDFLAVGAFPTPPYGCTLVTWRPGECRTEFLPLTPAADPPPTPSMDRSYSHPPHFARRSP